MEKMSYSLPLSKDHTNMEDEYCSGYIDSFGKWNTGFYCPQVESTTASYCCGTPTYKYCCTMRHPDEEDTTTELTPFLIRTPVMVGIIAGVTLVLLFITVASCFFCSCCFVYKKRQAHLTGGLYRMQCSSSTASGLVNMYSPSSTSNHNSLVTTPLDMEWSHQHQQQQNHRDHLMTIPSAAVAISNGNGNGYSPSTILPLSNGFPHSQSHHHQNNNYSHITLPRYQATATPTPPRPPSSLSSHLSQNQNQNSNSNSNQHQNHHINNLPPPVFYPQNHLGSSRDSSNVSNLMTMSSGHSAPPYSLTSSSNSSSSCGNYGTTPRPHPNQNQNQVNHHNYHPNLTLSSISARTQNPRVPTSILRVTNCPSALPPTNSFNTPTCTTFIGSLGVGPGTTTGTGIGSGPGSSYGGSQRPSSEIIINSHHPQAALMTLGRRNSGGGTLQYGPPTCNNSFSTCTIPRVSTGTGTGNHLNQKSPVDRSNFCVGGNGEAVNVTESLSSPCNMMTTTTSHHNRTRPAAINCQNNFQRLTACLASSDSQHPGLHASAL